MGGGGERDQGRREVCRLPVLPQRAVADSPRWTRAVWGKSARENERREKGNSYATMTEIVTRFDSSLIS